MAIIGMAHEANKPALAFQMPIERAYSKAYSAAAQPPPTRAA